MEKLEEQISDMVESHLHRLKLDIEAERTDYV